MARFPGQRVVVMPKLDGLSLSVIYEGGRLVRAATRGDGTTGEDVTPIARVALDGMPEEIPSTGRIEIRGEAVMLRSTFAAYNAAHPDKPLVNPRNGAAGTLRQKDASKALDRRLAFFAFDIHPPVDTDLEAVLGELSLQTPDMAHADTADEDAERGGMHHGVEVVGIELFLDQGFGAADLAERADAVRIAAHQGDVCAGVGKRAGRAAGGAAVADDQHAGVGEFEQAGAGR